jgi:hypothetical protein
MSAMRCAAMLSSPPHVTSTSASSLALTVCRYSYAGTPVYAPPARSAHSTVSCLRKTARELARGEGHQTTQSDERINSSAKTLDTRRAPAVTPLVGVAHWASTLVAALGRAVETDT